MPATDSVSVPVQDPVDGGGSTVGVLSPRTGPRTRGGSDPGPVEAVREDRPGLSLRRQDVRVCVYGARGRTRTTALVRGSTMDSARRTSFRRRTFGGPARPGQSGTHEPLGTDVVHTTWHRYGVSADQGLGSLRPPLVIPGVKTTTHRLLPRAPGDGWNGYVRLLWSKCVWSTRSVRGFPVTDSAPGRGCEEFPSPLPVLLRSTPSPPRLRSASD